MENNEEEESLILKHTLSAHDSDDSSNLITKMQKIQEDIEELETSYMLAQKEHTVLQCKKRGHEDEEDDEYDNKLKDIEIILDNFHNRIVKYEKELKLMDITLENILSKSENGYNEKQLERKERKTQKKVKKLKLDSV